MKNGKLEIRIASPCTEDWSAMTKAPGGDERVRHCAKCKLNVFNTREMSEDDVRALLLSRSNGGRVYRRRDGTILTKDCPTGVAKLRRKALMAIATVASMLVAGTAYAMGRAPACPTGVPTDSWFDRAVTTRVVSARETLRETKTFGPLIEKLWPSPAMMEMGDLGP